MRIRPPGTTPRVAPGHFGAVRTRGGPIGLQFRVHLSVNKRPYIMLLLVDCGRILPTITAGPMSMRTYASLIGSLRLVVGAVTQITPTERLDAEARRLIVGSGLGYVHTGKAAKQGRSVAGPVHLVCHQGKQVIKVSSITAMAQSGTIVLGAPSVLPHFLKEVTTAYAGSGLISWIEEFMVSHVIVMPGRLGPHCDSV